MFRKVIRAKLSVSLLRLLMITLLPVIMASSASANNHSEFKELKNLQTLAEKSKRLKLPIMLMFGAEWCEYCQQLNEFVFNPMMLGKLYEERVVLMRHVGVDESTPIPDWNGQQINKTQWAYFLNADLTPTVLFFDANGKEVAPRIVGISEITLYAGLIHERLNIAYKNMQLDKKIPVTPELLDLQNRELLRKQ